MARWKQRGKSATIKKDYKRLPLDEIKKKLKDEAVDLKRQQSQAYELSRFEALYRQAMMQERIKREKIKEAERIRNEDELRNASFTPGINKRSLLLAQNIPTLKDRTAELIENDRLRNIDQRNSSYKKMSRDLSTGKKAVASKSSKKTVLDPEDYSNFFNKNMEWLNHKMNKLDYLQSEKKKKEESDYFHDCGRYQRRYKGSSDQNDTLNSYYEHFRQHKFADLEDSLETIEKKLTFLEDPEEEDHHSHETSDKDDPDVQASNLEQPSAPRQLASAEEKENKATANHVPLEDRIVWHPQSSTKEKELVGALLNDLKDIRESMKVITGTRD
jgi:hypothetical protein